MPQAQESLSQFANKMNEVMPVLLREFSRRQENELYKGKITLPQFLILDFLSRQGQCQMNHLANFMHVTTAAMTGVIERLVRDGYAARVYDAKDRRIIKVRLTNKGNELVKRINRQRQKMIIKIFGNISEADCRNYLRILMQIKEILTKEDSY